MKIRRWPVFIYEERCIFFPQALLELRLSGHKPTINGY